MFNPKQRLEQIRKSKIIKEEPSTFQPQHSAPLFPNEQPQYHNQLQLTARLSRLQNTVHQLSSELSSSKQAVSSLRRQNSELQTTILKLQYENSQLKVTNKVIIDKQTEGRGKVSLSDCKNRPEKEQSVIRRGDSRQTDNSEVILAEVEESLSQIKDEPLESILHRKQKNFRALKIDPRNVNGGNKMLRQFSGICKDYGRNLKKPILVLKLQADDFE